MLKQKVDELHELLKREYGLNAVIQIQCYSYMNSGYNNMNPGITKEHAWEVVSKVAQEFKFSKVSEKVSEYDDFYSVNDTEGTFDMDICFEDVK